MNMVLNNIDYHICDICNLNCVSCNHFSPLAKKANMKTISGAEFDFKVLEKFTDKFNLLTILGGEALLNKDVGKILELANHYFPNRIKMITNGILIDKLIEIKDIIDNNNIKLVVTEYPFKENYKEHYEKIKELFPNVEFYEYRIEHGFLKHHLSYNQTNLNNDLIYGCDKRNKCCNYVDGKLYICHYAAFLNDLKSITKMDFNNEDSYIDLTTCTSKELDEFFQSVIPEICRYCLYVTKSYYEHEKQEWRRTNKNPNEWII